jgi:beta-glucanase (GH16 family)
VERDLPAFQAAAQAIFKEVAAQPQGLLHQDFLPDNFGRRCESEPMVVFDLHKNARGPRFADVAPYLAVPDWSDNTKFLDGPERRRERLSRHYLDEYARFGGTTVSLDTFRQETTALFLAHKISVLSWLAERNCRERIRQVLDFLRAAACLMCLLAALQPVQAQPPGDAAAWEPTFSDEFETFQEGKWQRGWTKFREDGTSFQDGYKVDDVFYVWQKDSSAFAKDGVLHLVARREPAGGRSYTSGVLTSFDRLVQRYGYFECRAKMPTGEGLAPSFRLAAPREWRPEIDVVETPTSRLPHPGAGRKAHLVYHSDGKAPDEAATYQLPKGSFGDAFHTFGVLWEPGLLVYYIDGVERFRTTKAVTNKALYMILSLEVGFGGKVWAGDPSATVFPQEMLLDWVRVWKRRSDQVLGTVNIRTKNGLLLSVDPGTNRLVISKTAEPYSRHNLFDVYSAGNDASAFLFRCRGTEAFLRIGGATGAAADRERTPQSFRLADQPEGMAALVNVETGLRLSFGEKDVGMKPAPQSNDTFIIAGAPPDDPVQVLEQAMRAPAKDLNSPWQDTGISSADNYGGLDAASSTTAPAGAMWLTSNGNDIYGTQDDFGFISYPIESFDAHRSLSLSTRVQHVSWGGPAACAGIMIRSSTAAESYNVNLRVTPEGDLVLAYRNPKYFGSYFKPFGRYAFPIDLRLDLKGETVTAYIRDEGRWKRLDQVDCPLESYFYAGLVVASNKKDHFTTAKFTATRVFLSP